MSNQYKKSSEIPNEVLANRLEELSNAVVQRMHRNEEAFMSAFSCRIPCELDRDADVVLLEASRRLKNISLPMPPTEQSNSNPEAPGPEISPRIV